jgi:predicted MFS family arabinose efflux permease
MALGSPDAPPLARNRDFRVFWAGETVSLFGAQVSLLALPLTALLLLDAAPDELGVLRFVEYLPFVLLALPLGVLADRRRRRPLLIVANAARAVLIGAIPVLVALDLLRLSSLLVVAFGIGTFTVLFDVCLMAYLPRLVAADDLLSANGRMSMSQAAAEVSGPGLAGVLVQFFTAPVCLALDSVSYLASVVSLVMIRTPEPAPEPAPSSPWRDLRAGLRFLLRSPPLRAVTMTGSLYNLAWALFQTAFLVYATRVLLLDVAVTGVVLAIGACGGLVGAATAPWMSRRLPVGVVFAAAAVVGTAPSLAVPLVSASRSVLAGAFAVLLFVMNGGLGVYNVLTSTLRQVVTPDRLLGRVAAGYRTMVYGGISVGGLVTAWLGGAVEPRAMLWIAGAIFVCAAVPIVLTPLGRHFDRDDQARR